MHFLASLAADRLSQQLQKLACHHCGKLPNLISQFKLLLVQKAL
jgi:hypothetical protein